VLPDSLRRYVAATATAIGCDPSFVALPLLCCLATAIGNKRVIRLKRSWSEPAIIWAAIVGKSGTHKTPAIQAAMQFLHYYQNRAIEQHAKEVRKYEDELAVYERDNAAWKTSRKKGPAEPPPRPPQEPVCQRYVTTDVTIEALAVMLSVQPDGLLVVRDELAGWLGGIAEYKGGRGSDLGHWLALWSAGPLTIDRKTGQTKMLHAPRAGASILGGIQPGVLKKAIGQEHMQDGLCARLLLAMPEASPVRWTEATVDPQVEAQLARVFERLLAMEPAVDADGRPAPIEIPLSDGARWIWVEYYNRHREEIIGLDDDLAAAWSKLEAYTARFALIFQLSAWAAGEQNASGVVIDEAAMRSAIALSDWFGNEVRRVYGILAESELERQERELIELIRRKGGRLTTRELMRASRRYTKAREADGALNDLVRSGSGRWEPVPAGREGGKPTRVFQLTDEADVDITTANAGNDEVMSTSTQTANQNGHDLDAINRLFAEAGEVEQP
jgi:hypothetical protein